ncbi:MAG TPA: LPS assembly protein LptD [Caulobacteraceae bacterium]|nr:LPS assembly protein LptD [Caulobacteraceae bacterium]
MARGGPIEDKRAPHRGLRRTLLAGALGLAFAPVCGHASPRENPLPPLPHMGAPIGRAQPIPPEDDGLAGGGFYLEADQLIDDEANHTVAAHGSVEARYNGRVVRADAIDYDQSTGVVTAKGDVTLINADGTFEFAQSAVLDKQLSAGVAMAFSSRLKDNISIAAASVVRRSPDLQEMNQAIFTPCPVCAKQPVPTWSIHARKVIEDKQRQLIYFQGAVVEVKGVPLLYVPALWEPTPETPRKSGFLIPQINQSSLRGLTYEQPYLQVISPSEDLVISPQLNTKVNPFLNLDWRKRFYSGAIDVRAGYTYEQDFNSAGDKLGNVTSRSYVLAKGLFAIDDNWRWGFTAERASDPLIFDRYGVSDPFIERGLYAADDRRLISQLFTTRQDSNSYVSIAAIDVQGLRSTDINATFPAIAPLIEARYEPDTPILGGRLRIDGSGVVLIRDESPVDPTMPGVDSRRGTIEADWRRTFIFANGVRLDPFVDVRGDFYSLAQLPTANPKLFQDATVARGLATAGATLSWPFVKRDGSLTYILEPIAQLAISPTLTQDPRIPNEDSVDFEFDETNLFRPDKSPGFDILDSGQRLNVGGRATVLSDSGLSASALFGRSFRAEADPNIPVRSGLAGAYSDWIIATDATPMRGVNIFTRWRLDADTWAINRLEVGADFATSRVDGQIRYLQEARDPTGQPVKDLDFHGEFFVLKNWGVTAYGAREFTTGVWREQDFGIVYKDECIRVEVVWRRDNTFNGVLGPSEGVGFRLSLATFGNSGYARPESDTPSP